jgi:hypothetical protein
MVMFQVVFMLVGGIATGPFFWYATIHWLVILTTSVAWGEAAGMGAVLRGSDGR